jgi:hypothetical protein
MGYMVMSYRTMRKVIGILAILMPFILVVGDQFSGWTPIRQSFSAYYWSNAGVLFTGMLITFGIFLITYHGYDFVDNLITTSAGIAMILTALFPMEGGSTYLFGFISSEVTGNLHYTFAASTFILLGVMSLVQFSKGLNDTKNLIHRGCGGIILIMVVSMFLAKMTGDSSAVFFPESIIVWAFGISWLVKGVK